MPALSAMAVYFSSRAGDHRVLHSFPTRRSSDLRGGEARPAREGPPVGTVPGEAREDQIDHVREKDVHRPPRSEEHTSELQSRRDLVCRLLLEKKKSYAEHYNNTYMFLTDYFASS